MRNVLQGRFELPHGLVHHSLQARLQISNGSNSAIWRTPYSEKRPAGTVLAAAWQTAVIQSWMRNRDVIEFLGLYEKLHNPSFNPIEFEGGKKQAGTNAFTMSPKIIVKLEFENHKIMSVYCSP